MHSATRTAVGGHSSQIARQRSARRQTGSGRLLEGTRSLAKVGPRGGPCLVMPERCWLGATPSRWCARKPGVQPLGQLVAAMKQALKVLTHDVALAQE